MNDQLLPLQPSLLPPQSFLLPLKANTSKQFRDGSVAHTELLELCQMKGWPPLPAKGTDEELEAFLLSHGLSREQVGRKMKKQTTITNVSKHLQRSSASTCRMTKLSSRIYQVPALLPFEELVKLVTSVPTIMKTFCDSGTVLCVNNDE